MPEDLDLDDFPDEDLDEDEELAIADLLDSDEETSDEDAECVVCGGIIGVDVQLGEETDKGPLCASCMDQD